MADKVIGKITQIIGAVLDIKFSEGKLPEINEAIRITRQNGEILTVEVAQHLGDDTVRCIAMGPTDGLIRGMDAVATGAPITVPVVKIHWDESSTFLVNRLMKSRLLKQISTYRFTDLLPHLKSRRPPQKCWKPVLKS